MELQFVNNDYLKVKELVSAKGFGYQTVCSINANKYLTGLSCILLYRLGDHYLHSNKSIIEFVTVAKNNFFE
jgi:hypothetical protein